MNRVLNVARMQVLNRMTFIGLPLIILGGAFLLSLMIFALIPVSGVFAGGAPFAPIWYYIAAGAYGLSLSFPFSQAMSVTRRDFFLGTMLTALLSSSAMGILFTIGGLIEDATDGWGMKGLFFRVPWVWEHGPLASGVTYLTLTFLMFCIGFFCSIVYKRWGVTALTVGLLGLGLVLVGATFLITKLEAWDAVGSVFTALGAMSTAVLGLVGALILAAASYLALRRTIA